MEAMSVYKDYLKMLVDGHINSVLCHSRAGLGKTYTTVRMLKEMGVDYKYVSGVSTAVALYKLLFENNGKVLVLDDIETLFQDDRIINILKSALWPIDGDKRVVSYKTSSKSLEGYPDAFEYDGRVIILMNELKGRDDESYKALLSRTLKYELFYTNSDVMRISKQMVWERADINESQKRKVLEVVSKHVRPEHKFNFRLLERLVAFVKYDINKSSELFLRSLNKDDDIEVMRGIIERNTTVAEQVREFYELTGKSRMTFFRKRKQLQDEGFLV